MFSYYKGGPAAAAIILTPSLEKNGFKYRVNSCASVFTNHAAQDITFGTILKMPPIMAVTMVTLRLVL